MATADAYRLAALNSPDGQRPLPESSPVKGEPQDATQFPDFQIWSQNFDPNFLHGNNFAPEALRSFPCMLDIVMGLRVG